MNSSIGGAETPPPLKIAIVGGAPSSQHMAPFNDPSWQIWGMAFRLGSLPRWDVAFEVHEKRPYAKPGYEAALIATGKEIVTNTFPDAPNVNRFPMADAQALMGPYLTSSAAYMMALAILRGADEIGLYGCDMAVDDDEYFYQRPCVEAWIGFARGRGIKVTIPEVSPLGKSSFLYGVDAHEKGLWSESGFKEMAGLHAQKMAQIEAQIAALKAAWQTHDGSKQAYERMANTARAVDAGQTVAKLTDTVILK